MRSIFSSLLLGIGALAFGLSASAQTCIKSAAEQLNSQQASRAKALPDNFKILPSEGMDLKALDPSTIAAPKETGDSSPTKIGRTPRLQAAAINGYYVGTYSTLSSGSYDGGGTMQIVPDAEGDSITINYFWNNQKVRAFYDKTSSKISIPSQYIMVDASLGALKVAAAQSNGSPDYTSQIEGAINADGSIDFTSAWWGIYVQTGTNKDKFVAAYYNLLMQKPSGTMTYLNSSNQKVGFYVLVEQTSKNTLKVTNIFNHGLDIEVKLFRDRTAEIKNQVALINASGSWSMIKCTSFNDAGNLTGYSGTITTDAASASDNTTLKWTDWSLLCTQASAYAGKLTNAELTAASAFSYPELTISDFEGEGTEANPYKISSLDHLILLADKVNNDKDYVGQSGSQTFSRSFLGKYFAVTADIDMEGYQFDPIGYNNSQRFAGTIDGQGHTIKGLNVNAEASYYGGLFGMCDSESTLKNFVMESPSVTSLYFSAGGFAGYALGTLENITVKNASVSGGYGGTGAVAGIAVGKATNCHAQEGSIYAPAFLGGVIGEAHGGPEYCSAVGTQVYITGNNSPAGGVIGNIVDANASNLYFSGLLTYANLASDGGQIVGGVAGAVQNVELTNSFSAGVMRAYSSESQLGGVVGILSSGVIENCYSSGVVHGYTRKGGGLVGQIQLGSSAKTPRVANCYTSATVEVETYQYDRNNCNEVIGTIIDGSNPELTNVYYDKQVVNFGSTRFGALTSELTSAQGPQGFPSDAWLFTEGAYPRIKNLAQTQAAMYSASAVDMSKGDSFKKISNNTPLTALGNTLFLIAKGSRLSTDGYYSKIVDNKTLEIGNEFGPDTLYVVNGTVQTYHIINIAPIPFEGEGSAESPFLIKTKADMIALSEATSAKGQMFDGMYFTITNDIDMEHDPAFVGINANADISHASIKFQGVLDGQGHTIDNIYIDRVVWTTEPSANKLGTVATSTGGSTPYAGLVGRLGENGVVKNLNIGAGSKFIFFGTSGAFAGSQDGLVENCRNYANVIGYSCWIGGITGQLNKGGIVRNCYNAGNVTSGYANVGGIVGSANNGTIENCANTGDISADAICTNFNTQRQRAGGITGGGSGSMIKNCVNYGTVFALLNNAGGISGCIDIASGASADGLASSLSLGNTYCGNQATLGAVLGLKGTTNVTNTYYDTQMIGLKAVANADFENIFPTETSVLISGEPLEGLSADFWTYTKGLYPTLTQFADEPKVAAARQVYANVAEGQTVTELYSNVGLTDGAAWSLSKSEDFKIEGNQIVVPQNVASVVNDTLIAINKAGVRRPILIQAIPAMPLSGKGTAENPYIVNSVDDWNALAAYIDATGQSLESKYVKLTADLDFTSTASSLRAASDNVSRIGADGVTTFAGTFDGDNHTIKADLASKANNSAALFGTVAEGAAVKNLTFEGTVTGAHTFATSIVDKLYGSLYNVTSKAAVTSTKGSTSGIVGNAYAGASLEKVTFSGSASSNTANIGGLVATSAAGVTYKDCKFAGKIEHTGNLTKATAVNIGGFAASAGASSYENCRSEGEITVANTNYATTVAGFLGTATGAKDNGLYTFNSCSNATSITAAGKIAGFIAGWATTAANAQYVLTDCYNEGDMTAESTSAISSAPTAGLVTAHTPSSSFTRCYNTGTIISNKNVYTAGITGYYSGTPNADTEITYTDCYNTGMIIADGNQGGGIIGYINGKVTLTNCYNSGDIEGNRMLGGIASCFAGTGPQMINCYNTGNITAKADRAGGLVAWGAPTNGLIQGCWNSGTIQSLSEVQDEKTNTSPAFEIAGLAGQTGATLKDCYNIGHVKGLARVAGLVSTPVKNKTAFENCYNAGVIEAPADSCGSIVGVNITNGKLWNADNSISGCYYLNINSCNNDKGYEAKSVSEKELAALNMGDGFDGVDDFTFPVVNGFANNENAMFYAAQLILSGNETMSAVASDFNVGGTPVVAWSSDCQALAFDGDKATFTKDYVGKIVVTASAGDLSKTYELTADAKSGIDSVLGDSSEVLERAFYTAAGIEVPQPSAADGQVYIVIEKLKDGTSRVIKLVNDK